MIRWRRLLRAKSSVDLTIVAMVLCVCVVIFRHLNQRSAVHSRQAAVEDFYDDDGGAEINLNEPQHQPQQVPSEPSVAPVALERHQRARDVDPRILHVADFRPAACRTV